jgi:hypothetical protein
MNGNKRHVLKRCGLAFTAIALVFCLPISDCFAYEGAASALSNVKELLVQGLRAGGTSSNENCGVDPDVLAKNLLRSLKNYGLPALSLIEAKPAKMGVFRIELLPEVVTSNTQGIECTSWVSLTAETQNTVPLPSAGTPRNVVVTYWRGGILASSAESTHGRVLSDTFDKLARQLSIQYNRDQPPPLPTFGDDDKKEPDNSPVK